MSFARLAQLAIVAATIVIGSPANAIPLAYGTYYDEHLSLSCSNVIFCRVNFSQLPPDKLLMANKINCRITSTTPISGAYLLISATLDGGPLTRLLPLGLPAPALIGGLNIYHFREDAHFLIGQARYPVVYVDLPSTTTNVVMFCTLIGDLVTPIPIQ